MTLDGDHGVHSRRAHDRSAQTYDRTAREARWFPEVLFGLCFDHVRPGEGLLALGVGTGLCIAPFARFGLHVTGADNSPAMLQVCRGKGLAVSLTELDLRDVPWPWHTGHFDHVIACGVLHFLADLDGVLRESARLIGPGGVFALTTKVAGAGPTPDRGPGEEPDGEPDREPDVMPGRYSVEVLAGVPVYSHRRGYLDPLLAACGLRILKELQILVGVDGVARQDAYRVLLTEKQR